MAVMEFEEYGDDEKTSWERQNDTLYGWDDRKIRSRREESKKSQVRLEKMGLEGIAWTAVKYSIFTRQAGAFSRSD